MRFAAILTFLFLFSSKPAVSQIQKQPFTVGANLGYGFVISHSPNMEYLSNQHIHQKEFYFEKNLLGQQYSHQLYNYPRLGFSFRHFQLNNPRHLGQAYSFAPYMSFHLFGGKFFDARIKTTLGLGYLEKPFDTESNYKNVAISSHINMFAAIGFQTEFKLSERWDLETNITFSHFSNTGYKKPNLGINLPTANLGLSYSFGKQKELPQWEDSTFQPTKAYWAISLSGGFNEIYPPNGKKFFATVLQVKREKALNLKSTVGGGLDFFYNPAQIAYLERDSIFISKGWENLQIGISAYHVLKFGNLDFITQMGYYLKKESTENDTFYHFVGGRIGLTKKWGIFLGIKTHYTVAEYFLVGTSLKL